MKTNPEPKEESRRCPFCHEMINLESTDPPYGENEVFIFCKCKIYFKSDEEALKWFDSAWCWKEIERMEADNINCHIALDNEMSIRKKETEINVINENTIRKLKSELSAEKEKVGRLRGALELIKKKLMLILMKMRRNEFTGRFSQKDASGSTWLHTMPRPSSI